MRSQTLLITPEMAKTWLTKNTRNRPLNAQRVKRLVRDLQSDRWVLTHQEVAFATDGTLIDGQHRLTAIAEAGRSALCVVWLDVPDDAVLGMDQGGARDGRDVAAISDGAVFGTRLTAVLNGMMRGLSNHDGSPTAQEQAAFYHRHRPAAEFAISNVPESRAGVRRASVAAVVGRAYYHVDHDVLRRFCEPLTTGVTKSDSDAIVIALRDFLLSCKHAGRMIEIEIYGKTARVLEAFRKGERITRVFASKDDPYPLPPLK